MLINMPINMPILGIESSCDETACAIVDADARVHANIIHSQQDHAIYGGVVPEIAARAHLEKMEEVISQALTQAQMQFSDLSGIAVTSGPGLVGGVMVGVMAAKAIAAVHQLPLYGINHLEGHALSPRIGQIVAFPYLLLLVSGGHCQVLSVLAPGQYQLRGSTRDDALGEAFDKTAKLMNLGYPGGPAIEKLAAAGNTKRFALPMPMAGDASSDFSFSGLKTAVRYTLEECYNTHGYLREQDKADMAASFQYTVCNILQERLRHALRAHASAHPDGLRLVVAGGVAANNTIRACLQDIAHQHHYHYHATPMAYCTDNAAMIAWAAHERIKAGFPADTLALEVRARWPL